MVKTIKLPLYGEKPWCDIYYEAEEEWDYPLSHKEQALFPLIDTIFSGFENGLDSKLGEISGDAGVKLLTGILASKIKFLMDNGLLTDVFYEKHKFLICEEYGLDLNQPLNLQAVKALSYDFKNLIDTYLYNMGIDRFSDNE
ncbi:MAG: hypothetical protein FWG63_11440 [Defluviitaleaceae bacterium]|nr:hypothetical protein [Defluviitaleaceae bacterium]